MKIGNLICGILALVVLALPSYGLGKKTIINNNVNVNGGAQAQIQNQIQHRGINNNINVNGGGGVALFGSSFRNSNFRFNTGNFGYNSFGHNNSGFYGNSIRVFDPGLSYQTQILNVGPTPVFSSSAFNYSAQNCEQLPAPQLQQELITTPPITRKTTVVEETIPGTQQLQFKYVR